MRKTLLDAVPRLSKHQVPRCQIRKRVSIVQFLSPFALIAVVGTLCLVRANADDETDATTADTAPAGSVRLVLPPIIPAVVGLECNVYFDNVVLVPNPASWVFDCTCPRGHQQSERWTWTPTDADVGDVSLQLDVRDGQNELIATAKTTIRVVSAQRQQDGATSVLCIGDSLTHASVYTQRLLDLSGKQGHPKFKLVGSHWTGEPGPNRHEGYGGWTAKRFATYYTGQARQGSYRERGSPFLYRDDDDRLTLNFVRYCRDVNEGQLADVATIFLGPNDIFRFTDENIEAGIDDMLAHMDTLIEMLRSQSPSTMIAVMLPVPPAATQDAFGSNYRSGQTRWQYKRNQHRLVERMLKSYAGRESERIHIVPTYVNLDCRHNYPTTTVPANAANDTKITRQSNSVHPSAPGYTQIGDTLFAWLVAVGKHLPVD